MDSTGVDSDGPHPIYEIYHNAYVRIFGFRIMKFWAYDRYLVYIMVKFLDLTETDFHLCIEIQRIPVLKS